MRTPRSLGPSTAARFLPRTPFHPRLGGVATPDGNDGGLSKPLEFVKVQRKTGQDLWS